MPRDRSGFGILWPVLLLALILHLPGCTVEEAGSEDPPASSVVLQLPDTEAGAVLAAALVEARRTDRRVFVHTGADW